VSSERPDFADVYDAEVWHVYGFLGYRVGSRETAEDLTQLTFERALRAWPRFDPRRSSARTWLTAIARNALIDHHRRGRERTEIPVEPGSAGLEPPDPREDRYSLGLDPDLQAALETLSERDRELIALRFGADLSGPEIAELCGLSLANVQQILSRALRALRERLSEPQASGGERADSG
jgi:RNA polymerase sigma factor (sigma-70 family)